MSDATDKITTDDLDEQVNVMVLRALRSGLSITDVMQAVLRAVDRHARVSTALPSLADMARGARAAAEARAVERSEMICTWPIDGRPPGKQAKPCNRTDCPYCRSKGAPR